MKESSVTQSVAELRIKEPLSTDSQEEVSTRVTTGKEEACRELESFEADEGEPESREVVRGLEELWGKAPLPADFREFIATSLPPEPAK